MNLQGGESLERKRHKRKNGYTVMLISNRADKKVAQFHLSHILIPTLLIAVLSIGIICMVYTMAAGYFKDGFIAYKTTPQDYEKIAQLESQVSELENENGSLQQKVEILSSTVNQKDERLEAVDAENTAKSTPTECPVTGTATIFYQGVVEKQTQEQEEQQEVAQDPENIQVAGGETTAQETAEVIFQEPEEYIVVFEAGSGTMVIATANGQVSSVSEDEEYGYCVRINHGNGYESIYRMNIEPKVKEGMEITRGTVIYELSDTQKIAYQIMLNGSYINPMDIMEIAG